jgi:CO dehydrogenase nickel-insertion accessory protein CooC1
MTPHKPLSGLRIGMFGKGGAGKSTVTVLLAETLRGRGYPVLVIDADSTNVGLANALGMARDPEPLLEYFGGAVFSGGPVTCPVDDPEPLAGASLALADLPPRYVAVNPSGVWILAAGKLGALGPGAGCDGPMTKIVRDLRVTDLDPDAVVLVDHKAGMEDSARGALTSLDWALVVVDPTTAALQMAIHLARMTREMQTGAPPATRHLASLRLVELAERQFREAPVRDVVAVLNRVPDADTEACLRERLGDGGVDVLGVMHESPDIPRQWLGGERLHSGLLSTDASAVARSLERRCEAGVPVRSVS